MNPARNPLTLSSGRIVQFERMPNGSQTASMQDNAAMSEAEWLELCALIRANVN
jgi:hypothetical protein